MVLARTALFAFATLCLLASAPSCSSSSDESHGKPSGSDAGSGASYGTGGSDGFGTGGSDGFGTGGSSASSGGNGGRFSTGGTTGAGGVGGQTLAGLDGSVVTQLCGGAGCACSNGKDDDGDGQIDGFDTECTGPLDNDEGSFATGIPGDNKDPKWQDCFFDGNSGAGNDGCRYATGCLTGELPQTDKDCELSQNCLDFCMDRTPNGCDCFGCCTIGTGAGAIDVKIDGSCSVEKLGDPKACPRCIKSAGCNNDCGTCELCPGKTAAALPPSCTPVTPPPGEHDSGTGTPPVYPPPPNTCDFGRTPCSTQAACGLGEYCQQGCCVRIVR